MDIISSTHRALLLNNTVSLPGSRDRTGSPLLIINPEIKKCSHTGGTTSSTLCCTTSYEQIVSLIVYLSQIPDESARRRGFTILIDGRRSLLKHLRSALRACQHALYRQIKLVLIIQPEKFLDQQRLHFDLIKEAYEFMTTLTSVHKLSRYVEVMQLHECFGGTFHYNAQCWIDLREIATSVAIESKFLLRKKSDGAENINLDEERYEKYIIKAKNWIQSSSLHAESHGTISANLTQPPANDDQNRVDRYNELLKIGDELLDDMLPSDGSTTLGSGNADWNMAVQKIENLIKQIKEIEEVPALEARRAKLGLIEDHAQGVHSLCEWIFGAGEKWLLTLHEIGESFDDAKQLLNEHMQLELRSKEVEQQANDLITMAHQLVDEFPEHTMVLEKSAEKLQHVSRVFCTRVTRQKAIAQRSVQFHQELSEFSHKTDQLLESLCTEVKATDIESTECERQAMELKVEQMDKIYNGVTNTGLSLIDELLIDESNSMGRAITRDYSSAVVHIREYLDETKERRRRCQNLADVKRLRIQQMLQLYTCEKDGEQALEWMEELHSTMMASHDKLGFSAEQLMILKENRMKLEETARSTYEYGKQLCQVALVLRRSLRLEIQPELRLSQRLENVWGRLCHALSANEAKLNISDAFYTTVAKVSERLDELSVQMDAYAESGAQSHTVACLQSLSDERRKIASDIRELKHIAEMLVEQIAENSTSSSSSSKIRDQQCGIEPSERTESVSEIQCKFNEIESKQQKLKDLWMQKVCKLSDGVRTSEKNVSPSSSSLDQCREKRNFVHFANNS